MPDSEKKLKRVVIKEELVALTGDWLRALILNQFLFWGQRTRDFDAFILEERLRDQNPDLELTHGWVYKSTKELADELMVEPLSEDTVRRRISELVAEGWLGERNNPYNKWDRTLQYRPDIRRLQRDLQDMGYALEGYPLLTEEQDAESNPQGAESETNGAESNLDDAASNPSGAEALPETPTETNTETTQEKGPPPLARADTRDPTDLPEAEAQMPHLFPQAGRNHRDGVDQIRRSGWRINSADHLQATACFLEASRLPVPFDKSARKDWLGKVSEHLEIYGLEALRELYPLIIAQMRGDGLTVSRPGSVTNNLASYWATHKNGGQNARPIRPELDETSQRLSDALAARARGRGP